MKTTYHKIFGKSEFLKKLILLVPLFLIFTCNEEMMSIIRPATLSTSDVTDIGPTTATVGGNITSNGGAAVTDRGVYWGTSSDPEITGSKLEMGSGIGSFSDSLAGLIADTKYYVKAYAHNGGRPTYGDEKFFLTISDSTNLDITMQNSNGSTGPYPSSNGEVHLYKKGVLVAFDKTDNFGLAQFKNLEAGKDYEARFYHDADITAPHGSEYWGQKNNNNTCRPSYNYNFYPLYALHC